MPIERFQIMGEFPWEEQSWPVRGQDLEHTILELYTELEGCDVSVVIVSTLPSRILHEARHPLLAHSVS